MRAIVALLSALCCFLMFLSCPVWAQSREERIRLSNEGVKLLNSGHALVNKARSKEEIQRAFREFDQALKIFEKARNDLGIERTIESFGVFYDKSGQYDIAAKYFEKALKLSKKIGDVQGEGHIVRNLAAMYHNSGHYKKAIECNDKALAISRRLGNAEDEATALSSLGLTYQSLGQYNKAKDFAEKALAIAQRLNNPELEARALQGLAWVYRDTGEKEKAAQIYGKLLSVNRSAGNSSEEGQSLVGLGVVLQGWGQYDKAIECYQKSLDIATRLGNLNAQSTALTELGMAYRDIGQYDRAIEHFQRALDHSKRLGKRDREGEILIVLGGVFAQQGDYAEALKMLQQGLSIGEISSRYRIWAKFLVGNTYLDMGAPDEAKPYVDFVSKETGYFSLPARYYFLKGEYDNARVNFEKFVKFGEKEKDPTNLFISWTGLGLTYEAMQDYPKAAQYFTKAVDQAEELRSGLNASQRTTFFDVKVWGFARTEPYEGLARVLMKLNKPAEALRQSEYTKSRVFAESMSGRSTETSVKLPEDILKKDTKLNDELASLVKKRQEGYEKGNREVIDAVELQIKEVKSQLQSHIAMLRKEHPLFAATKYPQPMDLSQTDLKDNEWVLAYHVTDPGVIIYLTRGKNLVKSQFKSTPRKHIDELVRKFREPLEIGPDDSVAQKLGNFDFLSGKKLSDLLLADILSDLPKNAPVIIIPDGSLGVVPFEMLVLNDGGKITPDNKGPKISGAEFFGDRNPISYYQSITALTLARTLGKQQRSGEKLLAMVDPVFSSDDPRVVKLAKQERDRLLSTLPSDLMMSPEIEGVIRLPLTSRLGEFLKKADPSKTDLLEGLDAKKTTLLNKDLTPYRSLVFATHGYFGKNLPGIQEPVLILSLVGCPEGQDGFLRLSEVMGLRINCDIAALTACQTGLGKIISGEGTMGMGRAFQYAGAKSVLMSLWSVAESSSVNLVESFFKHIQEGKNKLEALRIAREEIRKAGYDHPFYWASFILVGEVD